jgi:hypothetical protein
MQPWGSYQRIRSFLPPSLALANVNISSSTLQTQLRIGVADKYK